MRNNLGIQLINANLSPMIGKTDDFDSLIRSIGEASYDPGEVFNIGFTTSSGTVTAASDWGGDSETKRLRPGLPGSWEELFHQIGSPAFLLDFRRNPSLSAELAHERLERAIGVILQARDGKDQPLFLSPNL